MEPDTLDRRLFLRRLLLGALYGTGAAVACRAGPATHTVTIDSTRFQPAELRLSAGDTVVWVNKDLFPHTATAAGRFDSGSIATDGSWQHTVIERGAIDYVCTFHPTMKGTLRVE